MIPRFLVPKDSKPAVSPTDAPPRRTSSDLDARTLVPADLPKFELDPRSSIPSYFKLEVLGSAVVVPRDMPQTPLDTTSKTPEYVPLTILDSRVAVPKDAHSAKLEPKQIVAIQDLPDVLEPDVLTTGEVNLMAKPVEEATDAAWNAVSRVASITFHFVVILLILLAPKIFPYHPPSDAEIQRTITDLYIPSDLNRIERTPSAPRPKIPVVKIDPRLLRRLAPPRPATPTPEQPEPPREMAAQPMPKPLPSAPMSQPRPAESPIRPPTPAPDPTPSLTLPRFSPGKALHDSMQEALKGGGSETVTSGGPIGRGSSGGYGGGGGSQGFAGNAVQILTPTEGVDFSTYINRVLAIVKQNWYSVMPESARLGDRGKVVLQFRIMQNGVVPEQEPVLMGSSGKEPLDRAAMSSIRASTPFEPLPPAFSGPYIELRFIFLYNIPLNSQTAQ
ncbi:MAG TPA: TonB family protein [Candidatus Sulfotelmatobacter sp.]|jgi:TonB family protein|nr:TonB family protein [Candidatus Sulfotelmatobacter sp.]